MAEAKEGMKQRNVAAGDEAISYLEQAKALKSELVGDFASHYDDTKKSIGDSARNRKLVENLIHGWSDKAPSKLVPIIKMLAPAAAWVFSISKIGFNVFLAFYSVCGKYFARLPYHLVMAVFGLILCFFGGTFPMTIAAYEAFHTCGWENTQACIRDLQESFAKIKKEDDADNLKDENHDGIADVDEIGNEELVKRKTALWMRAADPDKISSATMSLYTACLAVLAALKVQFAKTVALGIAIGNAIRPIAAKFVAPALAQALPEAYHHWINTIINATCKTIAVLIAYKVQQIISAFHSGIRGGLFFARQAIKFTNSHGWTQIDEEKTYLDEGIGWFMAFLGIYVQLSHNFGLPFPINLLLLPFSVLEYVIYWCVTSV